MPAPQPQPELAQPFSQAALPLMRPPLLTSNMIPAWLLWWARLPLTVTCWAFTSNQMPGPML